MTKIDSSYLEKLGEVLYDEKLAVNYKTVSIMLGVHVNIAKQMLYHFYTKEKSQNKNIYATYYVSGMLSRKALFSIGRTDSGSQKETREKSASQESYCSPSDELDSFLVLICKDSDLEEYKRKFTKIFSIHVYSLCAFPLENYDVLNRLVERNLIDSEGRTPVDFGPVTCSASQKLLENSRVLPVLKETPKPVPSAKSTETGSSKGSKPSEEVIEEDRGLKKSTKSVPVRNDSNRLKNMFEKASTKPKPKAKVDVSKSTTKAATAKPGKTSSKSDSPPSKNIKNDNSRKRKRIRDVLSSSESEEEKNSEDEDSLPESPVPRKRIQIDSDSDDDIKKISQKSEKLPTAVEETNTTSVSGRRRVKKFVSKSHIDKDGFLVTTKEQVVVSEDEDSPAPIKSEASDDSSSKSTPAKPPLRTVKETPSKSTKNSSGSGPGKTKQSSLMSFFQKK